ncbi:MAG: diguanylate cyclase [Thermoguttaceae bacterium]
MTYPYIPQEDTTLSADILLVNDDPAILQLFALLLSQNGHEVRVADDGNQALHMILQDCPDILIVDWEIGGIDGPELCRRVRQLHQRKVLPHYTYILLLTAQKAKNVFLEGLEAGADDLVVKSVGSAVDLRLEIRARLKAALRTRKLERDLEFAAKFDAGTGLLNRATFYEYAQVVWERSLQNKFPISTIMGDCDFFKRINDIHGHTVGDAVLREIARLLKDFSRTSDLICRFGGEEFCVLLPGCTESVAWNWAERIRKQFEQVPIKHGDRDIPTTISFGIAERMEDTLTLDQLIERSDQALLLAKETGRNRCLCFSKMNEVGTDSEHAPELWMLRDIFRDRLAADIMLPFTQFVNINDSVAQVADFFIQTQLEQIPVLNSEGDFAGIIAEKNLINVIGNTARWAEPVGDLVNTNVITYPAETPLRVIFDFFCRVSARQIFIVKNKKTVGCLSRGILLRWMRKTWALLSGNSSLIVQTIERETKSAMFRPNRSMIALQEACDILETRLDQLGAEKAWKTNRNEMSDLILRLQEMTDRLVRSSAEQQDD